MYIKITINPGDKSDENDAVLFQGNYPEMKGVLKGTLEIMSTWMSGRALPRFPDETEVRVYRILDDGRAGRPERKCDNCIFYDKDDGCCDLGWDGIDECWDKHEYKEDED